jgi:hypothetical protein
MYNSIWACTMLRVWLGRHGYEIWEILNDKVEEKGTGPPRPLGMALHQALRLQPVWLYSLMAKPILIHERNREHSAGVLKSD